MYNTPMLTLLRHILFGTKPDTKEIDLPADCDESCSGKI